jgi:hypothetical protein
MAFILCCNQQNNGHLNGSNIFAEFQQNLIIYAMENIAGEVSMSVENQSTEMQTADVQFSPNT